MKTEPCLLIGGPCDGEFFYGSGEPQVRRLGDSGTVRTFHVYIREILFAGNICYRHSSLTVKDMCDKLIKGYDPR